MLPTTYTINDGVLLDDGTFVIVIGYHEKKAGDVSDIVVIRDKVMAVQRLEGHYGFSICRNNELFYVCCTSGAVFEFKLNSNSLTVESMNFVMVGDQDEFGELLRVRIIDGTPYCCGQCGQVYEFRTRKWNRFDFSLRSDDAPCFEDIAGTGDTYLAVGVRGPMYRLTEGHWALSDVPTNSNLSTIKRNPAGGFAACGDRGIILLGGPESWQLLESPDIEEEDRIERTYWDLEFFESDIFLTHNFGYDRINMTTRELVSSEYSTSRQFYRLTRNQNTIAAMGPESLRVFDGKNWSVFEALSK